MSKGQGFLGDICYPRVSQYLSCTLTEYDDGQQVNIPAPNKSLCFSSLSDRHALEREFMRQILWRVILRFNLRRMVKIADSKSQ